MSFRTVHRLFSGRFFSRSVWASILLCVFSVAAHAASIRGVVTDASGARITGATVQLISSGQVVGSAVSGADGSFQIMTGQRGRFFLVVSATKFRQLETPGFYAGQLDNIERNLVLEPEWVRESIVVTATGTPTPQPQTGAATSVIGPQELELSTDLVSALRLMPGTFVVQAGQRGSQSSLFVRGGASDGNLVQANGVNAGDLGGRFDFGNFSTTAAERSEIYRGPNSGLYGADAESGVVDTTTQHGTTSFPSLLFSGDWGNFETSHEDLTAAGTFGKLDYLGSYSWLQTANDLPNDQVSHRNSGRKFWISTHRVNRAAWDGLLRRERNRGAGSLELHEVADNATEKDQNLYIGASIDNQTTPDFHNMVRYGATRKREQFHLWEASNGCILQCAPTYGNLVTITGANGYSTSGQAAAGFWRRLSAGIPAGVEPRRGDLPGQLLVYPASDGADRVSI